MKTFVMLGTIILFVSCMSGANRTVDSHLIYFAIVDYERSVEKSIYAGRYDWANAQVTSVNFPSNESGIKAQSFRLIRIGQYDILERLVTDQSRQGSRPATLKELLAFAENYPNLQKDYVIVALGSSCKLLADPDRRNSNRDFSWQTSPPATNSMKQFQTFWPFIDSENDMRILDIGQINLKRRYDFRLYVACFVSAEE